MMLPFLPFYKDYSKLVAILNVSIWYIWIDTHRQRIPLTQFYEKNKYRSLDRRLSGAPSIESQVYVPKKGGPIYMT